MEINFSQNKKQCFNDFYDQFNLNFLFFVLNFFKKKMKVGRLSINKIT